MKRILVLLSLLAVAGSVAAESADIRILTFTTSKQTVATGDRITLFLRWKNLGPDTARNVHVFVADNSSVFMTTGSGAEGEACGPVLGGGGFLCRRDLAPGVESHTIVTMFAPSNVDAAPFAHASITASTPDPNPADNVAELPVTLIASPSTADLSIAPTTVTRQVEPGAQFSFPLTVTNHGPATARDVYLASSFEPGIYVHLAATGDGWSCQTMEDAQWIIQVRRTELAVGASSTVTITGTAPAGKIATYKLYARAASAGQNDLTANNTTAIEVHAGTPPPPPPPPLTDWTRILVPLPPGQTPGANGALWKTKITALLRSNVPLEPHPCATIIVLCPFTPPPVLEPFDLGEKQLQGGGLGEFVIVRKAEASQFQANARVWDVSRQAETAGSEIPLPRDDDFTDGKIVLLGIPRAAHYRHTLRIYDLDGRNGTQVTIRLYAGVETTPRATVTRTLTVHPDAFTTTDRNLSTRPASLQLDPSQLASLGDAAKMRIEIEPLEAGTRIWSFVSVTNNETNHVTTFSSN